MMSLKNSQKSSSSISLLNLNTPQRYVLNSGDGNRTEASYNSNNSNINDTNSAFKSVLLMVNPTKSHKTISNNSLCKTLLGIYTIVVHDELSKESKLIIQGFVPNSSAFKNRKLKIGDMIVSINDFHVNGENIENLLSAIKEPKMIKLTVQSPLKYMKLNGGSNKDDKNKFNDNSVTALTKNIDIVQGTRLKDINVTYDFPHLALILLMNPIRENENDSDDMKFDVVYKYPQQDDMFLTIRGMFVTLASSLRDMNNAEIKSCKIQYNNFLMNMKFIVHKNSVLVLAVPNEQINDFLLQSLVHDLYNTIDFVFGGLNKIVHEISDKNSLDILFSLFFERLLLNGQLINMKSIRYNDELKKRIFNAIPWFELPNDIKLNIETHLCSFEAQEFLDSNGLYFKHQRHFDILGSCLFFKTYLIQSHLNNELTLKIYNYCDNFGLLILSSNNITRQIQMWKEVYIEKSTKSSSLKHYILVIGDKEFLFVVLMEFGCVSRRLENSLTNIPLDPFLMEQAKFVLSEMDSFGIMKEINEWYLKGTYPKIVGPDKILNKNVEKQVSSRIDPVFEKQKKSSTEDLSEYGTKKSLNWSFDSDSGETSHYSSQLKLAAFKFSDDFYCNYQSFPDTYLNGRVFSYIISEENSNGILITPTQADYDLINSNLFQKLMNHFTDCCIKIKKFFNLQSNITSTLPLKIGNLDTIEQGVLFTVNNNNNSNTLKRAKSQEKLNDDKKRSKSLENEINRNTNSVTFWVVGRRMNKPYKKDFFICFHDAVNTVLQELAFDIGFNRAAF